jgi:hypothetical protein
MTHDIREIIEQANHVVARKADVDHFVLLVKELVTVKPLPIGLAYEVGTQVYRATNSMRQLPNASRSYGIHRQRRLD